MIDVRESVMIFTDSSTMNNGQRSEHISSMSCSAMYVPKTKSGKTFSAVRYAGEVDINRAELEAILLALKYARRNYDLKKDHIVIVSDNQYAVSSLTIWIKNWIKTSKNGVFYGSKGKPVENQDLIKIIYDMLRGTNVDIFHIRSHITSGKWKDYKAKFERYNHVRIDMDTFKWLSANNDIVDGVARKGLDKFFYLRGRGEFILNIQPNQN